MNRFDRALGKKPDPDEPSGRPSYEDTTLMGYIERFDALVSKTEEQRAALVKWLAMDESRAIGEAHHAVGQHIRNEWGMWELGSEVAVFFKGLGILHADDMSGIVMTSYHRLKNGRDIDLEGQVKYYQDYWNKEFT